MTAAGAPPNHRLSREHFDELCSGGGGPAAVRELRQTELSRRLLLLREVVEAHRSPEDGGRATRLGPLPPVAAAWSALVEAENAAREPVREVLLRPHIGNWAAYALRRRRGRVPAATVPNWLDAGVVHTIALLACAEAGIGWGTRLPVRHGRVMLPGLGMARFPDAAGAGFVDARTDGGRIYLRHAGSVLEVPAAPGAEREGWQGLRVLEAGGAPGLRVALDDLDPFRNLAEPVAPDRLSDAEFATWQKLLGEAWSLLCEEHPGTAAAMAEGFVCLVPMPDDGWGMRSASTGEAFGSVLISRPTDAVSLALSLVHEFQHTKLGGLMHLSPVCLPDGKHRGGGFYAPWRDDPRPLTGLVQGVYAYAGIVGFWGAHRARVHGPDRSAADFEYAYARLQLERALDEALGSYGLSAWGEHLMRSLRATVASRPGEPVDEVSDEAAGLLARFHRASWLARHAPRPSARLVAAFAQEYAADAARPAGEAGAASASASASAAPEADGGWPSDGFERWSLGFAALIRQRFTDPGAGVADRLRERGIGAAEHALVRRDLPAARAGYLARIAAAPADLDAWVGLGLADPDCAVLLEHARLAGAVHERVAALSANPDPIALARWLAPRIVAPAGVADARR